MLNVFLPCDNNFASCGDCSMLTTNDHRLKFVHTFILKGTLEQYIKARP